MMAVIGNARVSKADGSQVHDLECDALIKVGVFVRPWSIGSQRSQFAT